jgi:NitT/TauT family transport system substrate-binding protein
MTSLRPRRTAICARNLLLPFALVAAIMLLPSRAPAVDQVTLALNWVAQPELGGFYQALADGTYARYGLDVAIKQGGPMINNRPLLAFNRVEFLIGTNLLQPFDAAKQGIPTKAVAAFFQKDPQCLLAHPGQGNDAWDDLKRAPLFIGNPGRQSFFRWLNTAHGFPKENLRPYNHSLTPFLVDKKSAMQGFVTAEPMRIEEAAGDKPVVFLLADYGWSTYSTLLETRIDLIEKRPDMVQRFVDASILGWYGYLYHDRAAADALILKANPAMTATQISYSVDKMRRAGLVDSGDAQQLGIGAMKLARVRGFYSDMVKAGMYQPDDVNLDQAVTIQFVDKSVGVDLRPPDERRP